MVSFRSERVKKYLVKGVEHSQCFYLTFPWMHKDYRGGEHTEPIFRSPPSPGLSLLETKDTQVILATAFGWIGTTNSVKLS